MQGSPWALWLFSSYTALNNTSWYAWCFLNPIYHTCKSVRLGHPWRCLPLGLPVVLTWKSFGRYQKEPLLTIGVGNSSQWCRVWDDLHGIPGTSHKTCHFRDALLQLSSYYNSSLLKVFVPASSFVEFTRFVKAWDIFGSNPTMLVMLYVSDVNIMTDWSREFVKYKTSLLKSYACKTFNFWSVFLGLSRHYCSIVLVVG